MQVLRIILYGNAGEQHVKSVLINSDSQYILIIYYLLMLRRSRVSVMLRRAQ